MSAYTEIPKIKADNGELPPKVLGNLDDRYPGASPHSIEYWVSPIGDDTNDGSEDYPLATLAAAVAKLPDLIRAGHTYTITLEPGEWDETLDVAHILIHGTLTLRGSSGVRDRHKVYRIRGENITGNLKVEHIKSTQGGTTLGAAVTFIGCTNVEVLNIATTPVDPSVRETSGVIGLLADYGSNVLVRDSDFSGRRYGIRANYLSRVFVRDCTGTNNRFGIGARWGGILSTWGTHPTGDTNMTTDSGGIIGHGHGAKIGTTTDLALTNYTNIGDGPRYKKTYAIDTTHADTGNDLTTGQQIVARFQTPQYGFMHMEVSYGSYMDLTDGQGIKKHYSGFLRSFVIARQSEHLITASQMNSEQMQLVHTGSNGDFELIIKPDRALRNRWRINIDVTLSQNGEAPRLTSVEII
jgi:hypothetical protein